MPSRLPALPTPEVGSPMTPPSALPANWPDTDSWISTARTVCEFLLALVLLVPALPVLLLIAGLMKLTSRGPVLYAQTRLGKQGRPYRLYKVRTMVVDSEKDGARWSQPGDPRVTRLGRWLRKTHLDELPQLWNVLRGEMSLI